MTFYSTHFYIGILYKTLRTIKQNLIKEINQHMPTLLTGEDSWQMRLLLSGLRRSVAHTLPSLPDEYMVLKVSLACARWGRKERKDTFAIKGYFPKQKLPSKN